MNAQQTDDAWTRIGASDPYFGVLTSGEYQRGRLDTEALQRFFRTGDEHISMVLRTLRERLRPGFKPRRAADFGCGVGRLLPALAAEATEVVGIDVSQPMLDEASRNCASRGLMNVSLVRSDDALSRLEGRFDLIHSFIVFQHIPVPRGERLLRRLIEHLEAGGLGALHFTTHREGPLLRRAVTWARAHLPLVNGVVNVLVLRRPFGTPMMQMNEYDLGRLVRILAEAGCREILLTPTVEAAGPTRTHGVMVYFRR